MTPTEKWTRFLYNNLDEMSIDVLKENPRVEDLFVELLWDLDRGWVDTEDLDMDIDYKADRCLKCESKMCWKFEHWPCSYECDFEDELSKCNHKFEDTSHYVVTSDSSYPHPITGEEIEDVQGYTKYE